MRQQTSTEIIKRETTSQATYDARGIIFIDFLEKDKTVNSLLVGLNDE